MIILLYGILEIRIYYTIEQEILCFTFKSDLDMFQLSNTKEECVREYARLTLPKEHGILIALPNMHKPGNRGQRERLPLQLLD